MTGGVDIMGSHLASATHQGIGTFGVIFTPSRFFEPYRF